MRIIWSPLAVDRVIEVMRHVVSENPQAAETWAADLFERVDRLRSFPESGHVLHEIPRGPYRELLHGEYRVIHRVQR